MYKKIPINFENFEHLSVSFLEQWTTQIFSIYRPIYDNTQYLCSFMSFCFPFQSTLSQLYTYRQIDENAKKMLANRDKREEYRWHFVNCLVNHFLISHFAVLARRSVFSQNAKEDDTTSFLSSFSQNQRWTKSAILWEVYSDWFATSRNSARTCRNDKCIASFIIFLNRKSLEPTTFTPGGDTDMYPWVFIGNLILKYFCLKNFLMFRLSDFLSK